MAGTVAQLVLACGLLAGLVLTLSRVDRWVTGREPRRRWLRRLRVRPPRIRRRPKPPPEPMRRPIQVVAADLRRLARQLALVPAGAPLVRWQALWAAYDDVLMYAAAQLDVPHELPTTPKGLARDLERLRLQAALECAGLAVRG
jgi:hypothetical protein